jgi:hypothetical protein
MEAVSIMFGPNDRPTADGIELAFRFQRSVGGKWLSPPARTTKLALNELKPIKINQFTNI